MKRIAVAFVVAGLIVGVTAGAASAQPPDAVTATVTCVASTTASSSTSGSPTPTWCSSTPTGRPRSRRRLSTWTGLSGSASSSPMTDLLSAGRSPLKNAASSLDLVRRPGRRIPVPVRGRGCEDLTELNPYDRAGPGPQCEALPRRTPSTPLGSVTEKPRPSTVGIGHRGRLVRADRVAVVVDPDRAVSNGSGSHRCCHRGGAVGAGPSVRCRRLTGGASASHKSSLRLDRTGASRR